MPNLHGARHERLLNLAAWLHHLHAGQTVVAGTQYTEARFTRATLDDIPVLRAYSLEAGDAGEKAIIRDSKALNEFGLDLRWDATTQEWVSRATNLSHAERRALATAALSVVIEDAGTTQPGAHLPGAGVSPEAARVIVGFASEIDVAVEAVRTRTRIALTHRGTQRSVEPWTVLFRDGRWYLVGNDIGRGAQRVFSFDGIEAIDRVGPGEAYSIPKSDFEVLAERTGDPDRWDDGTTPIEVRLRVDSRFAGRAASLLGAEQVDGTTEEGYVIMTATARDRSTFIDRLFGLRARAIVIDPLEVRQAVVDRLEALT